MDSIPTTKLSLAISPHIKSRDDAAKIMRLVIYTLLPALCFGIYIFGTSASVVVITCMTGCMLTEMVVQLIRKKDPFVIKDGSALLTGILLAMTLPPTFPWPLAFIGSVFAILIGKALFGGLGYNIFNPALVGRAFLQASFPVQMTTWVRPFDAMTTATPLALSEFEKIFTSTREMFFGVHGGCIGETSALLLLLGAAILIYAKVIDYKIPFSIYLTITFWVLLFNHLGVSTPPLLFHYVAGGLVLGAFYMATDLVTSPITPRGSIIYGIGMGTLIIVMRTFGGLPEGVMYAILVLNAFVPIINRHTRPRILGSN